MTDLDQYIGKLEHALQGVDRDAFTRVATAITRAHSEDRLVLVCGNGGSAATASHMVNDLVKAPAEAARCRPIRAMALTDSAPLLTAFANDLAYSQAFAKQIEALGRPGDLLIALSASGNSENVLEAAKTARAVGITVVGMTGFQGGKLKDLVDIHLNVPCPFIAVVEDAHLILEHALVETLKTTLAKKAGPQPADSP